MLKSSNNSEVASVAVRTISAPQARKVISLSNDIVSGSDRVALMFVICVKRERSDGMKQ